MGSGLKEFYCTYVRVLQRRDKGSVLLLSCQVGLWSNGEMIIT